MSKIEKACVADAETMSCVIAASWKAAYRGIIKDDYLDALPNHHWVDFLTTGLGNNSLFAFVLRHGQDIVGVAILCEAKKKEAVMLSFYLLAEHIGKGLGHFFWLEIENEVRHMGFSKCVLDVLEENERAIRFYQAHGFVDTHRKVTADFGQSEYVCKVYEKELS